MITSTSNIQVKKVVNLQKKSKARKENKEFIVEGARMVMEAPLDRIVKVYASETFFANNKDKMNHFPEEKVEQVSDHVFMQMADTKTPQGIMAIITMADYTQEDLYGKNPLILIIENLQDPGNLGTILRMAEGAGVTGVLMSSNTVDIYNPKTIRSTMGSIYRVPFIYSDDFYGSIQQLKSSNIKVYAAHLDGQKSYTQVDYSNPSAFLIGNEGNGLTKEAAKLADELIIIPMEGKVESFNAAIATTILTFEAVRQRRV